MEVRRSGGGLPVCVGGCGRGMRRIGRFACKMIGVGVHTCRRLDFMHIKHFLKIRRLTNLSNRNPLVYRMTNNTYLISLLFKFFWRVA